MIRWVEACRGNQIALLNFSLTLTPKYRQRGVYLTDFYKIIFIHNAWKRHVPVWFVNCVNIAI